MRSHRVTKAQSISKYFVSLCLCASVVLLSPPVTAQIAAPSEGLASGADRARAIILQGEQLKRKWDLKGAEVAFRKARAADPANLEAALGLAQVARARCDYAGAISLLDEVKDAYGGSADWLAEYGLIYLTAEEPARARSYFERALKLDPACAAAVAGRAGVALLERDYKNAESQLRRSLARSPDNSRAWAMLSRALLESNEHKEAEACARRALALDPYDTDALYTLAFAKAAEGKADEVRQLTRRALALDPLHTGARRLLAQYLDSRMGDEQKVAAPARSHYERGRALKQQGKLAEAVSEFEAALRVAPRYYRALLGLGDAWWREGDYERAATAARLALEVDPEGPLAHLQLSYALFGLQEQARTRIGAVDFSDRFYRRPARPSFDLTRIVFPNYGSLTERQQAVIDRVVAPLAEFLPKLVRSGARHYLVSLDERISDVADLNRLADERTFDGRYYASIRGVGGRITASGVEYVEMAARGGFNTIAHEFAHQVHMTALSRQEVRTIRELYERAKRENRTLDYYAAANEYEYFAQGYEAFIAAHKRPSAGITARHTNQELLARDPALHAFFVKLEQRSRPKAARVAPAPELRAALLDKMVAACDYDSGFLLLGR